MGMDALRAHHEQDMSSHETLESMLVCTKAASQQVLDNKKPRPQDQQAQKCPRCDSSNTKFCYYNNYSLTQPRYFCKSCRRYWTKGGTLRNVPVGGGCRKNNKRSSSSSSNSSASSKIRTIYQDHHQPQPSPLLTSNHNHPLLPYDSTDLSLAFARLQNGQLGFDHDHNNHIPVLGNYANNDHGSFLDAIRYGNFLETPPINNGLQNVYYGDNHHFENVGNMSHQDIGNLPYEDLMNGGGGGSSGATTTTAVSTVTTVKQERSNVGGDAVEGRGMVLCGYPWQIGSGTGGDHGVSNMGDVDATGRQSSWINGFGASNWHGLINSPLM